MEGSRIARSRAPIAASGRLGCTMTVSAWRACSWAKAGSRSAIVAAIGSTSMASVAAAAWICARNGLLNGSTELSSTAIRFIDGTISRRSSTRLAPSAAAAPSTPVMLPPGRATLSTRPVPTGSPDQTTIGMVCVARLAARAAGVCRATMTSTLAATSSAASAGRRSIGPPADRVSSE